MSRDDLFSRLFGHRDIVELLAQKLELVLLVEKERGDGRNLFPLLHLEAFALGAGPATGTAGKRLKLFRADSRANRKTRDRKGLPLREGGRRNNETDGQQQQTAGTEHRNSR